MYYTYAYLREDGTPYYIGKGSKRRAYVKENHKIPLPPKDRILILKKNLTEEEAHKHEKYMVGVFGRKDNGTGILRNLTDGGEGGGNWDQERRDKLSRRNAAQVGEKNPFYGKQHTEETKKLIGEANSRPNPNKGCSYDYGDEWRKRKAESNRRIVRDEEYKLKMSKAVKAAWARKRNAQ
jgi:hypothetical protein